jgi:hypothetical protein
MTFHPFLLTDEKTFLHLANRVQNLFCTKKKLFNLLEIVLPKLSKIQICILWVSPRNKEKVATKKILQTTPFYRRVSPSLPGILKVTS